MIGAVASGDAQRKELIAKEGEIERLSDSFLRPKKTNW
jgi:hypothetical protein